MCVRQTSQPRESRSFQRDMEWCRERVSYINANTLEEFFDAEDVEILNLCRSTRLLNVFTIHHSLLLRPPCRLPLITFTDDCQSRVHLSAWVYSEMLWWAMTMAETSCPVARCEMVLACSVVREPHWSQYTSLGHDISMFPDASNLSSPTHLSRPTWIHTTKTDKLGRYSTSNVAIRNARQLRIKQCLANRIRHLICLLAHKSAWFCMNCSITVQQSTAVCRLGVHV